MKCPKCFSERIIVNRITGNFKCETCKYEFEEKEQIVAYCKNGNTKQQKKKIKEYIEKYPFFEIVQWFINSKHKNEYNDMVEFLRENENVAGVILSEIKKIGKDSFELLRFDEDIIENLNKKIIVCDINIDTSNREGKLIYESMSYLAKEQAKNIIERMKNGREKKYKENPDAFGRPQKIKNKKILDLIKDLYVKHGHGVYTISTHLKGLDEKDFERLNIEEEYFPIDISPGTVRNILKRMKVKLRNIK